MSTTRHITEKTIPAPLRYSESEKKPIVDWWGFLRRAERGEITDDEHLNHMRLARQWTTCAVGNQCAILQRYDGVETKVGDGVIYSPERGMPKDGVLQAQGADFHLLICRGNWPKARQCLEIIEARSTELIATLTQ